MMQTLRSWPIGQTSVLCMDGSCACDSADVSTAQTAVQRSDPNTPIPCLPSPFSESRWPSPTGVSCESSPQGARVPRLHPRQWTDGCVALATAGSFVLPRRPPASEDDSRGGCQHLVSNLNGDHGAQPPMRGSARILASTWPAAIAHATTRRACWGSDLQTFVLSELSLTHTLSLTHAVDDTQERNELATLAVHLSHDPCFCATLLGSDAWPLSR
jgi:hypothetical protein